MAKALYNDPPRLVFSEIWRRSTYASRIRQKSKLYGFFFFLKEKKIIKNTVLAEKKPRAVPALP